MYVTCNYEKPKSFLPIYSSIRTNEKGLFVLASNSFNTNVFSHFIGGSYNFNNLASCNSDALEFSTSGKGNITNIDFVSEKLLIVTNSYGLTELYITKPYKSDDKRDVFYFLALSHKKNDGVARCFTKMNHDSKFLIGTSRGNVECYSFTATDMQLCFDIPYAHANEIVSISAHPTTEQFVTSSLDRSCVLWDKKQENPASHLLNNLQEVIPTCVKWYSENLIVMGDSSGNLNLIDTRKPNEILYEETVSTRSIKSLTFKDDKFGVISESNVVKIFKLENNNGAIKLIHTHAADSIAYSMCWRDEHKFCVVGEEKYAEEVTFSEKQNS
jgi:WD40 repeat protein